MNNKNTIKAHSSVTTLSLCMIVKNEEKFLPQCLESIKGLADEIIIVDTGSTDRTVEIAGEYGAKVYFHPWEGDFSKSRNISLGYATCDWIFVLDADEELDRKYIPEIKSVIQSDQYDVIFCSVLSTSQNGDSKNYSHRIFRRGKAHYEGIVHNQLVHEGKWLHTNIQIYHYGYNLSKEEMAAKYRRTESLLLKQLEQDPAEPFTFQNYVRVLRVQQQNENAVKAGFKALDVCKDRLNEVNYQMIAGDIVFSLLSLQRYAEAEHLVGQILNKYPQNLDMSFAYGLVLQGQNKFNDALIAMKNFIKLNRELKEHPQHTRIIIDTFDFEHRAWGNISDCYFHLQDYKRSHDAIKKALNLHPEIPVYHTAYARVLIVLGRSDQARTHLHEYELHGNIEPVFYEKWAGLCLVYPDFGNPVEILQKGVIKFPQAVELRYLLATRLLPVDSNRAEKEFKFVLEKEKDHIRAHFGMATIYTKQKNPTLLLYHTDKILHHAPDNMLFKQVAGYCIRLNLFEKAIELLSSYLYHSPNDVDALVDVSTCYAKMEKYDAAFAGYKAALNLNPGNPKILRNIMVLQQVLKNTPA